MVGRKLQIINVEGPSTSHNEQRGHSSTDWTICCLCQEYSDEKLILPEKNTVIDKQDADYQSLANQLIKFHDNEILPRGINISRLNGGSGVASTLKSHLARWHKSCRNLITDLRLSRALKRKTQDSEDGPSPVKTRRSVIGVGCADGSESRCFFCDNVAGSEGLHKAVTLNIDQKVRDCAIELRDTGLLAKLSAGDMIALDAEYIGNCLMSLYNRARGKRRSYESHDPVSALESIALSELISYIEEAASDPDSAPVFKLVDLRNLYTSRLEQLGADISGRENSTRLKERIMTQLPHLQCHTDGRDVLLAFDKDIGYAISTACKYSQDADAVHLAKTAHIVRKHIFGSQVNFDGSWKPGCQNNSVPQQLLSLMRMVLEGPNIHAQAQIDASSSQSALSLSQLIVFNSKSARSKPSSMYHDTKRETPLPLYTGFDALCQNKEKRPYRQVV